MEFGSKIVYIGPKETEIIEEEVKSIKQQNALEINDDHQTCLLDILGIKSKKKQTKTN